MDTADHSNLERALINCVVLLSAGSAATHFAVMGDHFDEYWAYGVFFGMAAWLQILWAIALAPGAARWLLMAGVIGNAVIVVVWIISRTSGLPLGPNAGSPESVRFIDLLATGFEWLIVVGSVTLLRGASGKPRIGARAVLVTTFATALVVVPLTTVAIASVSPSHEGSGAFHGSPQMPHR